MSQTKRIIVLNAGTKTRNSFRLGVRESQVEFYKSKNIILHITGSEELIFIHKSEVLNMQADYVFTRLRATDTHFCGIIFEHLNDLNVPFSDQISLSYRNSEEKISQMPRLARAGILIPKTIICQEHSFNENIDYILKNISFPLVYKTDGSQGRKVFLLNNMNEVRDQITKNKPNELFLLQEVIENTFDTRTLVAFGKILGSIKRTAKAGAFHNNVAMGASVEAYNLTDTEIELAKKATTVCKLDFGGVDIIHTENGNYVLEVNKSPQIAGFESIYGTNTVFKNIANLIENKI